MTGDSVETTTPIKHVIVLIGENWTFDSIYATYVPKTGQSVANLLSRKIVNADGTPGPYYWLSKQFVVNTPYPSKYFIDANAAVNGKTAYQAKPTSPPTPPTTPPSPRFPSRSRIRPMCRRRAGSVRARGRSIPRR